MSFNEFIMAKEAYTFREMIEAIPFVDNDRRRLEPVFNTLILLVSGQREIKQETFTPEKTIAELSRKAEDNIKWVLHQYQNKLENRILFVIVRLEDQSWRCPKSKFRNNAIVRIRTLPTLMWFGDSFKLEGVEATSFMTIKEFIYQKQKEERITFIDEKVGHAEIYDIDQKPVSVIEFNTSPRFILKFWDRFFAAMVADEADKRVGQVNEGACEYDLMMDVFLRLCPDERRKFLKELEEAEPEMLPYNGEFDRGFIDKDYKRPRIELELDNPNVKSKIIAVERYPTPKQQEELKAKKKKKKGKGKKGKGKRKKGKGKGKKGKGKGKKGKGKAKKGTGKKGKGKKEGKAKKK